MTRITQGHWAPFSLFPPQWLLPFPCNLASKLVVTSTSNGNNVTNGVFGQFALFYVNIEVTAQVRPTELAVLKRARSVLMVRTL